MVPLLRDGSVPSATIDVFEPGSRPRRADYKCKIGQHLTINPDLLGRYCLKDLDAVTDDLVLVAGSVAFADRVVPRRPSVTWRRNLSVAIPVHDPDRWAAPQLYRSLRDTLDHLTGDNWSFSFKPRRHSTNVRPQAHLPLKSDRSLVMPYSDGLDSFAVARLLAHQHPTTPLVLVTTGNRKNRALDESNSDLNRLMYRVAIPFRLPSDRRSIRHREPSYRSRAFVFGVMAGIAAHLLSAPKIFIAESGQGALGPWLTPVGNEAPDVRMHPSFTTRLAGFLTRLFNCELVHMHPQLWRTKGETLQELKRLKLESGWWMTSSCARDQRHVSLDHRRIQCGVCAGCLLRRQSLNAAGMSNEHDSYLWNNLSARTLSGAVAGRRTVSNDERQALCAVLEMQQFAEICTDSERFRTAAEDLAQFVSQQSNTVENGLKRLIKTHAAEWTRFRSTLASRSFVNTWLDTLQ